MDKYRTSLMPFLFHLLSSLGKKTVTESISEEYDIWKNKHISEVSPLQRRKDAIFKETVSMVSLDGEERKLFFKEKMKTGACNLCLTCIECEKQYWQKVQRLLTEDNVREDYNLPKEVAGLLVQKEKPGEIYVKNYLLTRQMHEYRNRLIMLKGFSSSMPFLLNFSLNTNYYSGGGFYLNWNGIGIAVDPGYHFVQNLHQQGLNVLDIDVVIITHEHIDHNSDMRLLDDLHYNASKVFRDDILAWDKDNTGISKNRSPRHVIKWYMDETTYEMAGLLQKKGSGFDSECNELYIVKPEQNIVRQLSEDVQLQVFQTTHEALKGQKGVFWPHTFGCVFLCRRKDGTYRKVGYTSDTAYHLDIVWDMCEALKDCDIIIENISGIYKEDLLLKEKKDRHLGYYGCYKLIEDLQRKSSNKLQYILLSEFSNIVNDIRFDVAKYMQEDIRKNIDSHLSVYPAEVGLVVDLENLLIQCSECCGYTKQPIIVKQEDENMKMRYCCDKCTYTTEVTEEIENG